jgi:hypothetical protein
MDLVLEQRVTLRGRDRAAQIEHRDVANGPFADGHRPGSSCL